MSRKKPRKKNPPAPRPAGLAIVRGALSIALVFSGILLWQSLQSGGLPGCGPDSGCDKVLTSRWSRLFGAPVSIFAIVVYAILLGDTFRQNLRWPLISSLACIVVGAVVWFVIVQAAFLKAFCAYCLASHAAGFTGAILLLLRSPGRLRFPVLTSAGALLVLVLAQQFSSAPAPKQISIADGTSPAAAPQVFSILGGQFQLDLSTVPVSGDPASPRKLVKLFDYTCHHCRDLHHLLHDYQASNQVTIISLPVPLDPECNSLMTRPHPDHIDACEYARLGLAVFHANPAQFTPFSDWLFQPSRPYTLTEARAHAASLVGSNAFAAALRDPRINGQIHTNVAIYRASSQRARTGQMPQMLFQNTASVGAVADHQQLHQILTANLPR